MWPYVLLQPVLFYRARGRRRESHLPRILVLLPGMALAVHGAICAITAAGGLSLLPLAYQVGAYQRDHTRKHKRNDYCSKVFCKPVHHEDPSFF
jgi:hypothetical protein